MKILIIFLFGVITGIIVGIIRGAENERAKSTFKPTQETWLELEKFKWTQKPWCANDDNGVGDECDCWKNVTLGDCFNNCEQQEKEGDT